MFEWQRDHARHVAESVVREIDNRYLRDYLKQRNFGWQVTLDDSDENPTIVDESDLIDDLHQYLLENDLASGLEKILRRQDLVDLANQVIAGAFEYSDSSDAGEMLQTFLVEHDLRLFRSVGMPYSIGSYRIQLTEIKNRLLQYEKDYDVPDGTLRGLILDGWSGLESLIGLILIFLHEVFMQHSKEDRIIHQRLNQVLDNALRQPGLGSLIDNGLRGVGEFTETGKIKLVSDAQDQEEAKAQRTILEQLKQQRKTERHHFEVTWGQQLKADLEKTRKHPKADPIEQEHEIERIKSEWQTRKNDALDAIAVENKALGDSQLQKVEQEWQEKRRQISLKDAVIRARYQHLLRKKLGRPLLFEPKMLDPVIKLVKEYRNVYAHHDSTQLRALGLSKVIDSIDALLQITDILERNTICPDVVFMLGVARDTYGREIVLFICDKDFEPGLPIRPTLIRWMYKSHATAEPFRPYYLLSKKHYAAYEPLMVDANTILTRLRKWQSDRAT